MSKLLDQARHAIWLERFSRQAEAAYISWAKKYIFSNTEFLYTCFRKQVNKILNLCAYALRLFALWRVFIMEALHAMS